MSVVVKRAVVAAICALIAANTLAGPSEATRAAAIDRIFAKFDTDNEPGCSVGVFENGKTTVQRNYGVANVATRAPLTGDSVFYMASVSKQFTALTAVKLVEEGKLGLQDDVHRWLPELPDYGVPITVSMLMHHTSGIREVLNLLRLAGMQSFDTLETPEVLRMMVRQKGVSFTPGTRYRYSNGGYFLLARIVERAAGEPFHEAARKRIFEPLGMHASFFRHGPGSAGSAVAHGYVNADARGFEVRDTYPAFSGSGGLMSSVNDMAKYDRDFHVGRRVWTDRARQLMLAPGVLANGTRIDVGDGFSYGGGLRVGSLRGQPWLEHSGGHAAFSSHYAIQPQLRSGAIAICNRADDSPSDYVLRVLDAVHADIDCDFVTAPGACIGGGCRDESSTDFRCAGACSGRRDGALSFR